MQISKSIGSALQKITSGAGDNGPEVRDPAPDPEPTGQAELQPRQAESFQERYNQDRFE